VIAEWNIRACSSQCAACHRPFDDGERLTSRLLFTPEGYLREDYCRACWPNRPDPGSGLSDWSAVWHAPAPPPPEPLKKETAESLLRELMETDQTDQRNAIFILAVMLERRRILVEKDIQTLPDGTRVRIYEHKKTGESFVIPDPQLKLAEIATVELEVMSLLGIPPPGTKPSPPSPPSPKNDPTTQPSNAPTISPSNDPTIQRSNDPTIPPPPPQEAPQ
jgi:hypothetical protein